MRSAGPSRAACSPPGPAELPDRPDAVLRVIYLVFNEGYDASSGEAFIRPDLSGAAIRLGRQLADLHRRLGNTGQARAAYERALSLARQLPERRFLARRLAELRH